ncbi:threonine ammonia-lyase IlvA [Oceanicella sp. SM1341]|uniref:threonine ammonia-lyase IlvA n=1 Tax=Oceanicella sp. SM1341 TaxID=1548889 RepID=UPI000E4E7429|nr:threonine ammonia-lyase IlvA [Oceanicella sp. SM1341]
MTEFAAAAEQAAAALAAVMEPTPLQRNAFLSERYGADIWLKREDLSPVRSYKLRGAFTFLSMALQRNPEQARFVCASAGNHAQGFAWACRHFGRHGTVFMPVTTPEQKIMKTRVFGGEFVEVVLTGDFFDASLKAAQEHAAANEAVFVPPFDADDTILGQATVAVEILAALPEPDLVMLPVGGGGLAAGVTKYFAAKGASAGFRFVEPETAASLYEALNAGHPVTLPKVSSFVDGAAVARIGERPFAALHGASPAQVIRVAEGHLCRTMVEMLNVEGVVLEPAGALSIDALADLPPDVLRGRTVVCVVSGGNFDFERLPEVKERAMRHEGRKKYFILRLPQRPGALKDFLGLLGPDDDIARFEYLKKSARNFGSILLGIETKDPAGFPGLYARMEENGIVYEDITGNDTLMSLIV